MPSHIQVSNSLDVYGQLFLRPQASNPEFIFDTAPHRVQFRFSEDVSASLGSDDLILENLTTMQTIPADQLLVTYDTTTNTATFRFAGLVSSILPDGNYRATLLAAGISSPAGVPMQANHIFNFFFLNGDADRDADVDLDDFNLLASNFNTSGRTFSQGNFSYDTSGTVDLDDFNILATRFGQALSPTARRDPFGSGRVVDRAAREDELSDLLT